MKPALLERVGRSVTIAEPQREYWYSRTEGIAEHAGVVRRVCLWRAMEPVEDVLRGIANDAANLTEIGGGAIPEIVELLGPVDARDGFVHTDDALVTWEELLRRELDARGRVQEELAIAFVAALADALVRPAERSGLQASMYQPSEDLALAADGRLVLTCHVHPNWRSFTHGAAAGLFVQDLGHMAPEVIVGSRPTAQTFVYTLGYVLHRMLTGRAPYEGDTAIAVLVSVRSDPVPDLGAIRGGLSPDLVRLTNACLAKEENDRPTLDEARTALEALGPESFVLEHWVERHVFEAKETRRRLDAALARMDFETSYRTLEYVVA